MGELLLEPLGSRLMIPALCFEADFSSFVYSPNTFRQCIHVIIKSVKILKCSLPSLVQKYDRVNLEPSKP